MEWGLLARPAMRAVCGVSLLLLVCVSRVAPRTPAHHTTSRGSDVTVNTKLGTLLGTAARRGRRTVTSFLGVPYAERPRRFHAPLKHPGWGGRRVWRATRRKPRCPDDVTHDDVTQPAGEDCLYLNVFVPLNLSTAAAISNLRLPVLVYLHGDGASGYTDSGKQLAVSTESITVTFSYRQGVLGFFSTGEVTARGNYGLQDQRLALHWIWDNVRELGGHPERITLLGFGGAARHVGYHVIIRQSRGLFGRAVMIGGSMLDPCCLERSPISGALRLATALGCDTADLVTMVTCVRNSPLDKLLHAAKRIGPFHPVIDRNYISDDPESLLRRGLFNKAHVMLGYSNHDGYDDVRAYVTGGVTREELLGRLRWYAERYYPRQRALVYGALRLEYGQCEEGSARALLTSHSAVTSVAPAERAARLLTAGLEGRVHMLALCDVTQRARRQGALLMQSRELEAALFAAPTPGGAVSTARHFINVLRNYVQSGNPSPSPPGGAPRLHWPAFTELRRQYLCLSDVINSSAVRSHNRRREMALINDYFPAAVTSPHSCSQAADFCLRDVTAASVSRQSATATALIVLAVVCCVLTVLVITLLVKLRRLPGRRGYRAGQLVQRGGGLHNGTVHSKDSPVCNGARHKQHPLPYFDESMEGAAILDQTAS